MRIIGLDIHRAFAEAVGLERIEREKPRRFARARDMLVFGLVNAG
jgi:hypothetical protein